MDNHLSFSRYHYCIQNNPLLQATHINIGYVSHKLVPIYIFASKSYTTIINRVVIIISKEVLNNMRTGKTALFIKWDC